MHHPSYSNRPEHVASLDGFSGEERMAQARRLGLVEVYDPWWDHGLDDQPPEPEAGDATPPFCKACGKPL